VYNVLVRTTRQYARDATAVEPAWLPELAPAFFARRHANQGAQPPRQNGAVPPPRENGVA
jgi:hypothetical protein